MNKQKKGITLIALIITVIVLLILAGTAISISVNSTDLFNKTNTAKESWNAGVREEKSKITETLDTLNMAANPDLAKNKLKVTINLDGTVESPYYVNYPSAKGTIKCRALYNDSTYGLQIISVEPIAKVELGKKDTNENVTGEMSSIERAQNSYNRAITTLNEAAAEYIETTNGNVLAIDARCVGSNPLNKNFPDNLEGEARDAEMYKSSKTYMSNFTGKYFKTDSNHEADLDRLQKIGAAGFSDTTYENYYWLASRNVYLNTASNMEHLSYAIKVVDTEGELTADFSDNGSLWVVTTEHGTIGVPGNMPRGLRPVLTLSPSVIITGGEGTEEVPYEIGL